MVVRVGSGTDDVLVVVVTPIAEPVSDTDGRLGVLVRGEPADGQEPRLPLVPGDVLEPAGVDGRMDDPGTDAVGILDDVRHEPRVRQEDARSDLLCVVAADQVAQPVVQVVDEAVLADAFGRDEPAEPRRVDVLDAGRIDAQLAVGPDDEVELVLVSADEAGQ